MGMDDDDADGGMMLPGELAQIMGMDDEDADGGMKLPGELAQIMGMDDDVEDSDVPTPLYELAQVSDDDDSDDDDLDFPTFPPMRTQLAQVMDESEDEAMNNFDKSRLLGEKKVIKCHRDGSWRTCTEGTEIGCMKRKVCKPKTGYETAIVCFKDLSIKFCNAGTEHCKNNDKTLCNGKPTPPPKPVGTTKTVDCGAGETRQCRGGTNGCSDNGAACSAL